MNEIFHPITVNYMFTLSDSIYACGDMFLVCLAMLTNRKDSMEANRIFLAINSEFIWVCTSTLRGEWEHDTKDGTYIEKNSIPQFLTDKIYSKEMKKDYGSSFIHEIDDSDK